MYKRQEQTSADLRDQILHKMRVSDKQRSDQVRAVHVAAVQAFCMRAGFIAFAHPALEKRTRYAVRFAALVDESDKRMRQKGTVGDDVSGDALFAGFRDGKCKKSEARNRFSGACCDGSAEHFPGVSGEQEDGLSLIHISPETGEASVFKASYFYYSIFPSFVKELIMIK